MRRVAALIAAAALVSTAVARAEQPPLEEEAAALEALHDAAHARRVRLSGAVLGWGALSTVAGIALAVPDADNLAWRVAGGATLAFGAIDVVIAALGLVGLRAEERAFAAERAARRSPEGLRRARLKMASAERREGIAYAVNLGLDVAYLAGGLLCVGVSRTDVVDPERWLAVGIATTVQALFLAGIDIVGTLTATRVQSRLLDAWAKGGVAVLPTVAPTAGGVTIGAAGRF
jgi:hypothetical protein